MWRILEVLKIEKNQKTVFRIKYTTIYLRTAQEIELSSELFHYDE